MPTDVFELEIIQPTKAERISVFWIEVESPTGNFLVGADHSPLVSIVKERGVVTYKMFNGSQVSLDVYGGVFRVAHNKALLILDS
ncbi:hypothetical protein KAT92_00060 [Candidatus Babeliales bacterium]|nr:hypothetical protein [Candidatus Babeliales bacterium]